MMMTMATMTVLMMTNDFSARTTNSSAAHYPARRIAKAKGQGGSAGLGAGPKAKVGQQGLGPSAFMHNSSNSSSGTWYSGQSTRSLASSFNLAPPYLKTWYVRLWSSGQLSSLWRSAPAINHRLRRRLHSSGSKHSSVLPMVMYFSQSLLPPASLCRRHVIW